ncbi:imelysin family protein [Neolewinella persica]|uniref:imelysin family protein n=1 Tax=Neolewinella persica TaxID=70998 RepID=UPI00037E919B|nr:imelysin family protein [Neolewinella persica]
MSRYLILLLLPLLTYSACSNPAGSDDDDPMMPSFDRREMLKTWADEVIIPAHNDFEANLEAMAAANEAFSLNPGAETLTEFQNRFKAAYLSFQRLDPFLIGKGEEIRMRELLNTYPANVDLIQENADSGAANLDLPSNTVAQGFPALEFLLHAENNQLLTNANHRAYATALIDRMLLLNETVLTDWNGTYRDLFIQNDGNSATASIDRTINDYIFHYEKFLRAGKVGIPAGVFSDDPLADRVEALYAGYSKELFLEALSASRDFFTNRGLKEYLDVLNVRRDGELLSSQIEAQFAVILEASAALTDSFAEQVEVDNVQLLGLYDEMQRLVVLMKVDMVQALSINIDYVDADGD